jgi:hypothetical protein
VYGSKIQDKVARYRSLERAVLRVDLHRHSAMYRVGDFDHLWVFLPLSVGDFGQYFYLIPCHQLLQHNLLAVITQDFDNTDREAVGIQHSDDQSTLQMQDERICIR